MRRFAFCTLLAATALAASPVLAAGHAKPHHPVVHHVSASHGLSVPMDEVRMVAFVRPVATVYVGNPMIADVNVVDARHVFVLGKTFGATNIIALDADGKEVANDPLTVYERSGNVVTLHRGGSQTTFACAGSRCESSPVPGDAKDPYDTTMGQVEKHQDMGVKAASAADPGH